ncbi:MAG TPA: invasion associated locus B family protein [Methyloceanibacter sp.]|jgi:invasion protein IalB|nr:invasion associated locus B family protein [Methyloceanibacter sp.]
MIGSRHRWNSLRRGAARLMLCGGATALALALAAPLAMAQQEGQAQPKSTQPKSAPTAAAPAAGAQAPAGAAAQAPAQDAWVKLCMKNEQTQNKEICLINHEGLDPNSGMVLITAMVRKVEGEQKQQLIIRLPTAYALVIPAGVQAKIDEDKPIDLQYMICFPAGCQAQTDLTPEVMEAMRKGKQMVVAAVNFQQKTMGFPVPLSGFNKAFDGPAADPVKYEESRKQLMEMFRKRQQELAAKAAQGKGPDQTGAAPAPGGPAPAPQNATTAPPKAVPAAPPAQ